MAKDRGAQQTSRRNKAAWRKNIDLSAVEAGLEDRRAAERVGLAPVTSGAAALFVEDREGDEEQRRRADRQRAGKKPLKSLAVLQSTSSMAPVQTRARKGVDASLRGKAPVGQGGLTPEQRARRHGVHAKEMERLRRAAGRDGRDAFGAVEEGQGAPRRGPEAVMGDAYDVWAAGAKGKEKAPSEAAWLARDVQLPATIAQGHEKRMAMDPPQPGQSYNPAAAHYEALLGKALADVQQDEERLAKERAFKRTWDEGAARARASEQASGERVLGMVVDGDGAREEREEEEEEGGREGGAVVHKATKRKTKQQRSRAQRRKAEERAQEAARASKAAKQQLSSLRTLTKTMGSTHEAQARHAAERRVARQRREAERGTAAYKLPKRHEDVQLGDELAESLRQVKPQGNLLRERIHAFQKRGYLEPRPATHALSAKRLKGVSRKRKEYEVHSYKRFA